MTPLWHQLDPLWETYGARVGDLPSTHRNMFPDFLIIGPPKTGTTWMADALRQTNGFYIPEQKELHYFNHEWKRIGLAGYLAAFADHAKEIKGEATPNYALLPPCAIATIAALNPSLKIVMLVRNPIERAWSQLKHCRKTREDTFRDSTGDPLLDENALIRHLVSDYSRSGNDYPDVLSSRSYSSLV